MIELETMSLCRIRERQGKRGRIVYKDCSFLEFFTSIFLNAFINSHRLAKSWALVPGTVVVGILVCLYSDSYPYSGVELRP